MEAESDKDVDVSGLYKGLWDGKDLEASFEGFFVVCLLFWCVSVLFSPFSFGSALTSGLGES